MSNHQKTSLLPIFFTVLVDMLGVGIIIPVIAPVFLNPTSGLLPFSTPLSTRTILMGILISVYPLAQFFGAPLLGAFSDQVGRKKILLISLFGTFLGYLLFAYGIITHNLPLMFLSRMIDGFTGGNISIAMSAISDISDPKEKARNFGLVGMAFGLGFIIGPYIGGKLSDPTVVSWFNFSTPFFFSALLAAINLVLVTLNFPETLAIGRNAKISLFSGIHNIQKAFHHVNLRYMFLVSFLLTFGFSFFTQFFQVFLIEKFSFTQGQIGDLFAYMGLWIAFTQGGITRPLAKKFNSSQILSFSIFILGLVLPLMLLPHRALYLLLILPFVAMSNGLTQPNSTAIISNLADPGTQGETMGINQSVQSLAQALPPLIAGAIVSVGSGLPVVIASITIIMSGLVFVTKVKNTLKFDKI